MTTEPNVDIEKLIKSSIDNAIQENFTRLGIDTRDPFQAQRDFQALRELREMFSDKELAADLIHLRKWRMAMNSVRSKSLLTSVGMILTGVSALFLVGLKKWFDGS